MLWCACVEGWSRCFNLKSVEGAARARILSSAKSFRSTTGLNINSPCWILFLLERKTSGWKRERKLYIKHPVTQISFLHMHMWENIRKSWNKKLWCFLLRRLQSSEQKSRAGLWIKYRIVSKLFSLHCSLDFLTDFQQPPQGSMNVAWGNWLFSVCRQEVSWPLKDSEIELVLGSTAFG